MTIHHDPPTEEEIELAREFVRAEEDLAAAKNRWEAAFTALRMQVLDDPACDAVAQVYAEMGISPAGDYGRVMVARARLATTA